MSDAPEPTMFAVEAGPLVVTATLVTEKSFSVTRRCVRRRSRRLTVPAPLRTCHAAPLGEGLMDSKRWARINEVFAAATEAAPDAREALLDAACAGDTALRAEVVSLLKADQQAGAFLETPAATVDEAAPTAIGPWRVVRELGRGGMATVFLVERSDGAFQMQAALKLMRRGLDTDDLLARFRAERQILASLEHPHIARLLDGGATTDGRPYLVMEYVAGEDLLTWCRRHDLGVRARVELFRQLADAVQYAHRNLVVHRDLKPGNVMVAADGTPKLLDFGIARVLTPTAGTDPTHTGARALTPAYASPEQLRGGQVTTASDVWALGVLLYELLAGRRPFEGSGETLTRAILDEQPPRPSAVAESLPLEDARRRARALRGDLDNIVLMALNKDPAGRYGSAVQLSEDLDRHLTGRPVRARAASVTYRLGKFARRHRWAVAGVGLVAASLTAGLVATAWQARRADQERARAEQARAAAEDLVDFMLGDLRRKLEPRSSLDVMEDVSTAVQAYFATLPAVDPEPGTTARRARLLHQLANVRLAQGKLEAAAALVAQARQVLAHSDDDLLLAATANLQARVDEESGDTAKALAGFETAWSHLERRARAAPLDARAQAEAADAANDRGRVLSSLGRPREAAERHEEALALLRRVPPLAGEAGRTPRLFLAHSLLYLGRAHESSGQVRSAQATFRENLALTTALAHEFPEDLEVQEYLAISQNDLGRALRLTGQADEAATLATSALAISAALLAKDPGSALRLDGVSAAHSFLGRAQEDRGDFADALTHFTADAHVAQQVLEKDGTSAFAKQALADALTNVGRAERKLGHFAQARAAHGQALGLREQLLAAAPTDAVTASDVGLSHLELGRVLTAEGKAQAAAGEFETARGLLARVMSEPHPPAKLRARLTQALLELGRVDEARPLFEALVKDGATDPELRAVGKARGLEE